MLSLAMEVMGSCSNFNVGTKPRINDIVKSGQISQHWSLNSNTTFFAQYDQSTDYFYFDYKDGKINVSEADEERVD